MPSGSRAEHLTNYTTEELLNIWVIIVPHISHSLLEGIKGSGPWSPSIMAWMLGLRWGFELFARPARRSSLVVGVGMNYNLYKHIWTPCRAGKELIGGGGCRTRVNVSTKVSELFAGPARSWSLLAGIQVNGCIFTRRWLALNSLPVRQGVDEGATGVWVQSQNFLQFWTLWTPCRAGKELIRGSGCRATVNEYPTGLWTLCRAGKELTLGGGCRSEKNSTSNASKDIKNIAIAGFEPMCFGSEATCLTNYTIEEFLLP